LDWHYKSAEDCKNKYYSGRARELETAVVKTREGLVFRREEYFATHVIDVSKDPEEEKPQYRTETRYKWPQIDNPMNDSQRAWNKFMSESHPKEEPVEGRYCDDSGSYEIGLTGADFVSITVNNGTYCHGAAHGFGGTGSIKRILSENRDIVSSDVFKAGTGWEDALEKFLIESFKSQGKEDADYSRLKNEIANPRSWNISSGGLQINLGELNGHAHGEYIAKISWQELKPHLTDNSSVIAAVNSAIADQTEAETAVKQFLASQSRDEEGIHETAVAQGRGLMDLDNDGQPEIVLVWQTLGPTYWRNTLTAFSKISGKYKDISSVPLGSEAKLFMVNKDGIIRIDQRAKGPKDAICCPTVETHQLYKLQNGSLTEVEWPRH
jgi:hypothetical protein